MCSSDLTSAMVVNVLGSEKVVHPEADHERAQGASRRNTARGAVGAWNNRRVRVLHQGHGACSVSDLLRASRRLARGGRHVMREREL